MIEMYLFAVYFKIKKKELKLPMACGCMTLCVFIPTPPVFLHHFFFMCLVDHCCLILISLLLT